MRTAHVDLAMARTATAVVIASMTSRRRKGQAKVGYEGLGEPGRLPSPASESTVRIGADAVAGSEVSAAWRRGRSIPTDATTNVTSTASRYDPSTWPLAWWRVAARRTDSGVASRHRTPSRCRYVRSTRVTAGLDPTSNAWRGARAGEPASATRDLPNVEPGNAPDQRPVRHDARLPAASRPAPEGHRPFFGSFRHGGHPGHRPRD